MTHGGQRPCQHVGLVEDQRNIVLQLGLVPFDHHHIVAATLHDAFGDGALGEPGIHGDDPSLHDQPAPHGLQDRDRMGLVSHGWLSQGSVPTGD